MMILALTACGSSSNDPGKQESYQLGTISNGVYENKLLKIGFKFQEAGFHEENGKTGSSYRNKSGETEVSDETLTGWMIKGQSIYELYCQNYEDAHMYADKENDVITVFVLRSDETVEDLVALYDRESFDTYLNNGQYSEMTNKSITVKIGKTEFKGYDIIYKYSSLKGLERCLIAKVGKLVYCIKMMSINISGNIPYSQLNEHADSIVSTYMYGL